MITAVKGPPDSKAFLCSISRVLGLEENSNHSQYLQEDAHEHSIMHKLPGEDRLPSSFLVSNGPLPSKESDEEDS